MLSLLAAILVFGLIILFHEFGHFLLAKRGGICVVEFSLGMGPRLFSFVKGGTRYSLKLLPFGGSCMMLGEDEDEPQKTGGKKDEAPAGEDGAGRRLPATYAGLALAPGAKGKYFDETSVWTRFLVIAAGPFFNFLLALICAFFVIGYAGYDPPRVYSVESGYPAEEAGIREGDVITRLNGKRIRIYRDILAYTAFHAGEPLTVEYERDGRTHEAFLEPKYSEETGSYLIGISGGIYQRPESVLTVARYSVYELRYWIDLTFGSLGMIVKRQVSSDDIAGPVRIVSMIDSTVDASRQYGLLVVLMNLANLCVLLSANLGVMNLLPIPALDGGRLVFILLEMVRGKPVDREKEGMIHMAGMALLMTLMIFILFNDVRNLL